MRLPRLRFTVRRLLLVVAVAACGGWGVKLWRLSREYAEIAKMHREWEPTFRWLPDKSLWLAEYSISREHYHDPIARKYERAARYPWLHVEPDPPEP
jgi:hypothetical protein